MPRGRSLYVIDTNVPVTANRRDGGTYTCASSCARLLRDIQKHGKVILDDKHAIFDEYRNYLNFSGQPGIGDVFFRWIANNRGRVDLCETVSITKRSNDWREWEEFPDDIALAEFDRADQKFVAASVAHAGRPQIAQATDHKWLRWDGGLLKNGVNVKYLCKEEMMAVAAQK